MLVALTGLLVALVLAQLVLQRELLRRALMRVEDPRALGLLRIVFGVVMIVGALEPVVEARWLFSDEGMFLGEGARAVVGDSLAGYEEGAGFRGAAGLWHYLLSGDVTPLHFWSGPGLVTGWCVALMLALVGFVVGWRTRLCGAIALALYLGLIRRNTFFWGGEQVYCHGLLLLLLARCGHAYSVDNWLRCRRLRAAGLLSEPGGPGGGAGVAPGGEHPQGLAAIYRLIPAWPRLLIIAQVTLAYGLNGLNKSGTGWWDGTGIFYVLQNVWARFDARPLAVALVPTGIEGSTFFVLAWESLFPLVAVGSMLRFARREGLPRPRGARWLWLAIAVVGVWFCGEIAAHHPWAWGRMHDTRHAWWLLGGMSVGALLLAPRMPGRWAEAALVLLGRRLWLGAGLMFTVGLVLTLNVGMFPLATIVLGLAFFRGEEVAAWIGRVRGTAVVPAEDRSLPHLHHDDARLSGWAMGTAAGVLLGGAVGLELGLPTWGWRLVVMAVGIFLLAASMRGSRAVREDMSLGPWAYGPAGRLLAGCLCAAQLAVLVAWAVPHWKKLEDLNATVRRPVAGWLRFTGIPQAWRMFSSPSKGIDALQTYVVDAAGVERDLQSEWYGPTRLRRVALWNWRQQKVEANVEGGEMTARWYARALCRQYARVYGAMPRSVELWLLSSRIAPPSAVVPEDRAVRFLEGATRKRLRRTECASEPHGQWPGEPGFVPLPVKPGRWEGVRAKQGPLWPYDEWIGWAVIVGMVVVWRRRAR